MTADIHSEHSRTMPPGLRLIDLRRALEQEFRVRSSAPSKTRYRFYDTHEWGLWFQHLLLCETDGRLLLCDREHQWLGEVRARLAVSDPMPMLAADFPDPAMRALLEPAMGIRAVSAVAEIDATVRTIELLNDNQKVVFRCCLVNLHLPGDGKRPFYRLCRPQPLRGYDAAAESAFRILGALGAAAIGETGPLGAYFGMRGGLPAPYTLKPRFDLSPEMPTRQAIRRIVCRMLAIARSSEAGIIDDIDTEFLHDYRICIRKIRSVLSLIRGAYPPKTTQQLKTAFSLLARKTNRLRDLDVYLLARPDYLALIPHELRGPLTTIFDDFTAERKAERRGIVRHFGSAGYRRRLDSLEQFFTAPDVLPVSATSEPPIGPLVSNRIYRRYRKIRKLAGAITHDTPDEAIHELRIQCKKLRYLLEFFAELFPPDQTPMLLKRLRRLQNRLGEFNDSSVQKVFLLDYWENTGRSHANAVDLGPSIGGLVAVLHLRQRTQRERCFGAMERFCRPDIADRFKALFKAPEEA